MLLALAAVSASLGWSLARVLARLTGQTTLVGWSMPCTMAVLSVSLLFWTLLARPRLLRKPGHAPLPPLTAARTAALALAASRVGAFIAGSHVGLLLAALPQRETVAGRDEIMVASTAVILSCALVAVGRWLESLCRIKSGGDNGAGSAKGAPSSSAPDTPAGSAAHSPNT